MSLNSDVKKASPPVSIVIETEDNKTFRIGTADLKMMAAQLRPKAAFSPFNSIILPIGVTVLTALLTTSIGSFFQWVSWRNSVELQGRQAAVANAVATFNKATTAIDERSYATLVFIDAVVDMANRKHDIDSHLYRLDLELNKRRYDGFYSQLKSWTENFEQMIAEIDFAFDVPLGIKSISHDPAIEKPDCSQSLPGQLKGNALNPNSLRLQYTVIAKCFAGGIVPFATLKDRATIDATFNLDEQLKEDAKKTLNDVNARTDEFRCYALERIEFLKARELRYIYIPDWLSYLSRGETIQGRDDRFKQAHFDQTEEHCRLYYLERRIAQG